MESLSIDGREHNIPAVDPDRCLGCGVCVSTCPPVAIHLIKKDKEIVPPADYMELIMKIGIGKGQAGNPT